jgi:hypothetical protein
MNKYSWSYFKNKKKIKLTRRDINANLDSIINEFSKIIKEHKQLLNNISLNNY